MNNNDIGLWTGLVGISASLATSIVGFYYLAKANRNPLRESLYNKQIELTMQLLGKQGRFRVLLTLISDEEATYKLRARKDILVIIKEYSELKEIAAAILPTDLWILVANLSESMTNLSIQHDENMLTENLIKRYIKDDTKVALLMRSFLGVDELSNESLKLFSNPKRFQKLTKSSLSVLLKKSKD